MESPVFLARVIVVLMAAVACVAAGCSSGGARGGSDRTVDGMYDSEFPALPASPRLAEFTESVRMINTIAAYRTYQFPIGAKVRASDMNMPYLLDRAEKMIAQNRRASGSALLIYARQRRLALVSCAHIVDFPDTMLTFHMGPDRRMTDFVRTLSVKDGQEIYVAGIPGARRMEVLAMDRAADLVLIGKQFDDLLPPTILPVQYPIGRAKELGWGTFVYILGYPSGFRMVTRAVVSSPNRDQSGTFLLDAGFKPGYSGGAIIAVRDGVPNFEIVGIIKAAKGSVEYMVSPTHEGERFEGDVSVPYQGDLWVERRTDLDHGVAEAVPAEVIMEFLSSRLAELNGLGYDIIWGTSPGR
jgi:hypothetical protein